MNLKKKIYTEMSEFIKACWLEVVSENYELNISENLFDEIADDERGGEWYGLRLVKLPVDFAIKEYVDGRTERALDLQITSKQKLSDVPDSKIGYSELLEMLGEKINEKFEKNEIPSITEKEFAGFVRMLPAGNSTLAFANDKLSMYNLDLQVRYLTY